MITLVGTALHEIIFVAVKSITYMYAINYIETSSGI